MSRSSRHVARDRITSSRLSRQLASGGAPFIFRRVSEAAPSSRCRRSPFSKQRGSCSGDRSNTPFLPPSRSFSPVHSSFLSPVFLFSIFPTSAALLALSRSCVSYVRTNSISRDSLRSGSAVNYFSNSSPSFGPVPCPFLPPPVPPVPLLLVPLTGSLSSSSL